MIEILLKQKAGSQGCKYYFLSCGIVWKLVAYETVISTMLYSYSFVF
jgi:hypothetical protein